MKRWIFATFLTGSAQFLQGAPAAAAIVLSKSVLGAGGSVSIGALTSVVTVGRPAIGRSLEPSMRVGHGFWSEGYLQSSGVDDEPNGPILIPSVLAFGLPAPNPTRRIASFGLALQASGLVRLLVVDVTGRLVSVAQDGRMDAGRHSISWDARDGNGMSLARGAYYARLEVDGKGVGRRSIMLIR